MLRKTIIHLHRHRIDVTKECRRVLLRFDMHTRITKVGSSSYLGHFAIHHNGGHAVARFEIQSIAISITVGHVPIGFVVVGTSSKVLNGHEILLSVLFDLKWQYVVDIVVDTTRKTSNQIPFLFFIPIDFNSGLFGLSGFGQVTSSRPIGDGGIVQQRFGPLFHSLTLRLRQKIFNGMDLARRPIDNDSNLPSIPNHRALRLRGIQRLIGTRIIFQ
mmetsp:Transcript_30192/g.62720  ORF Transcript_30192/g.62720 Transcript_30192/m.62720 type:complete len:216 (-) Transcript_30192:241-888(-)